MPDMMLIRSDARHIPLADESVHCVVTSPPYWGLRSYQGGENMIGLEPTFEQHLENLVTVFREVWRVLRPDGTCWLNYGDAYADGRTGLRSNEPAGPKQRTSAGTMDIAHRPVPPGLKPKDLMLMPARVALALQADGWWVRSKVIWHKCLSGGAWLYAETQKGVGPHMLKDLVRLKPWTVRLWSGEEWTQVRAWAQTQTRHDPIEIVLRSGERIGCTRDHRWPTNRGLLSATDLQVGDVLDSSRLPESGKCPEWLPQGALWFAGLYLAEGSRSADTIQISGHAKESTRWFGVKAIADYFGASARQYIDGNKQSIHIDRSAGLRAVLDTVLAGRTARDKRLHANVWGWNNESLATIMRGYLSGDGSDRGDGRWRLGFTRNYGLERDFRCLAARLNATLTLKPSIACIGEKVYPAFRGEWCWGRSGHSNEKPRTEIVEIRGSRARHFWDVAVEDDPHLFALASGVLTHNSNPMPESATDRPTNAYEEVFLLSKSGEKLFWTHRAFPGVRVQPEPDYVYRLWEKVNGLDGHRDLKKETPIEPPGWRDDDNWQRVNLWAGHDYFYDAEAVRLPPTGRTDPIRSIPVKDQREKRKGRSQSYDLDGQVGANLRNVWKIPTQSVSDAHFATFPEKLVEPCILAGTSAEGACAKCGAPWARVVDNSKHGDEYVNATKPQANRDRNDGDRGHNWKVSSTTLCWKPTCECEAPTVPCVVLDPFVGSGTTLRVATRFNRQGIGLDLAYQDIAKKRTSRVQRELPIG